MRENTCCFTGHRAQKLPWRFNEKDRRCLDMIDELTIRLENAISFGYNTFMSGMALGFDMIAVETLLKLKKKHKDIKIIACVPWEAQDERWPEEQKKRYRTLLKKVDFIRCVNKTYTDECLHERNHYMIDNSGLCIALFNGLPGGTKKTIEYAERQGVKVDIIKP